MNYSARERFEQLMRAQGQGMAAPMQGTRSSQMLSAVRMARGGEVGSLPTLAEMSDPNFQFQGVQLGANAPFTQFNPIVPMFSLEAPAFGGMEQSTYDFTAPVVQAGRVFQPPRQAPVMTESTSAFRPVDATTVMDSSGNIPNVPVDPYTPPDPYTFVDPNTPAPYVPPVAQTQPVPPVAQTQPVPQPTPPISSPAPVAPPAPPVPVTPPGVATTGTSIPTVITAEERAAREAAGIQAELERRQAAAQAAQQAEAQAEAQRLEQAEQERLAAARAQAAAQAQARAQAEAQARAQAAAQAQARQKAQADAAAASERDRIAAEAAQAERNRNAAAQAERERIAAAQAADPRIQLLRERFGLFGGSQTPTPTLAPGHRISGDNVVWQEDVGGEGSMLTTRRVPLANYRASDYTSSGSDQGA